MKVGGTGGQEAKAAWRRAILANNAISVPSSDIVAEFHSAYCLQRALTNLSTVTVVSDSSL